MPTPLVEWISDNRLTVAFCSVAVFVIVVLSIALTLAPGINEARASTEAKLKQEVAQESQGACEKWGLAVGTVAHMNCIADLVVIRANHDHRNRAEFDY
jgi:hypothetical protein